MAGITVSPAQTRLDLASDLPQFQIRYTNSSPKVVYIELKAQDFSVIEDQWQMNFLDPAESSTYRYSLSSWLSFTPQNFLLFPGQTQEVAVSVHHADLAAGAHYASILANISDQTSTTSSTINFQSQLASLVFVRTHTGQERFEAKINSFSTSDSTMLSLPAKFSFRLDNSSNVDIVPAGTIIIHDWRGREVSRGLINENSLIVLPESIRRFDNIPITVNQPIYRLPGPYQATLTVTYAPNLTLTKSFQFFSLGTKLNFYIILIFFTFLIIFIYHRLKKHS